MILRKTVIWYIPEQKKIHKQKKRKDEKTSNTLFRLLTVGK